MKLALVLYSFSCSEFFLLQLYTLTKQSQIIEQVKGSFGLVTWIYISGYYHRKSAYIVSMNIIANSSKSSFTTFIYEHRHFDLTLK